MVHISNYVPMCHIFSMHSLSFIYFDVKVQDAIDMVKNSLLVATTNCFSSPDTDEIIDVRTLKIDILSTFITEGFILWLAPAKDIILFHIKSDAIRLEYFCKTTFNCISRTQKTLTDALYSENSYSL